MCPFLTRRKNSLVGNSFKVSAKYNIPYLALIFISDFESVEEQTPALEKQTCESTLA
jgi:hypothetical protein